MAIIDITEKVKRLEARDWQPIDTATVGETVDVWAKRWRSHADDFEQKRFTNCKRRREKRYSGDEHCEWEGVPDNWCPTHWMALPEAPNASSNSPTSITPGHSGNDR